MSACPFLGALHRSSDPGSAAAAAVVAAARSPTTSSSGAAAQQQQAQQQHAEAQQEAPPSPAAAAAAVCPFGYTAAAGPRLSTLHCCVCKTFMHEPTSCQPCGHMFCHFCISRLRDCPVCGCDIAGLQPETATQGAPGRGGRTRVRM